MRTFDVVIKTDSGELLATLDAPETIPTGLLLQAVMTHEQFVPHLARLGANGATTILVTTPNRLTLPPGFTIVFPSGVNINGPVKPSPVPNVPPQFHGVQLTYNLKAIATYRVDPGDTTPEPDEAFSDWADDDSDED